MHHGGRDGVRSGSATPRRSFDRHQFSARPISSLPGTPRSEPALAYPTYDNAPPSVSGATDMDYEYDETDLGPRQQSRPISSVRFSESSHSDSHSHRSAPAEQSNRGQPWDDTQGHRRISHYPLSPLGYSPGQRFTTSYDQVYTPDSFPGHHTSPPFGDADYCYAGPPSSSPSSYGYFHTTPLHRDVDPSLFGISAPHHHPGHHQIKHGEVLPTFPHRSRSWYDGHLSPKGYACTSDSPARSGQSGWESESLSKNGAIPGAYDSGLGHQGMTDIVKEERMKMLEREFGRPKVTHKGYEEDTSDELDEDADLPLGSVTSKGRLILERPKWIMALRILQGVVSLIACACGIGGLLFIKTTSTSVPAPKGTFAAYLLYACSIITLIALLYFHVFRACCCDPMRKEMQSSTDFSNPLGGMIIPILSGGGSGGKIPKKKRFGKKLQQNQAPTVNLIVDPSLLSTMGGRRGKHDNGDSDDGDEQLPGDARRSSKRKNGLGVFGVMQMQRRWRLARRNMKLLTALDTLLCLVWIACDVVTLGLGKKCPASTDGVWCTLYNLAMASGVILAILSAIGIYFDYRALKVSRDAPRPPM